jgi:polar amino acid transport system substrate-binding protein
VNANRERRMMKANWQMMKRYSRIGSLPFALFVIILVLYAACVSFAPRPVKPDPTWTRIQKEGVLRIGIDPSFPPFESDDGNGNLSGFDIALATSLAQKWNVRVQYVYTGFDGLYDALVGNQFDMILSALPYNPQKTEDVFFSRSYFNGGPVLVVRAEDNQTKSLYDAARRSVAVELGTSGDEVARRWQHRLKLELKEFGTTREALLAVESGQVAAGLVDPISFYDFERTGDTGLKSAGKALADESYIIAVRKDSPTLLQEINSEVDAMERDGSLDSLQKKWF